jgi:putative transposase
MPRTARAIAAGYCYHVINRGNNRARRFHTEEDYRQFVRLMAEATERIPLAMIGACLMPNHVHLVVRPNHGADLSRWIHWLFLTYSRRYHRKYGSSGRVWENRYKAFPIQGDAHLLVVLRYVERNALRANLTDRAERWEWGSLNWRWRSRPPLPLEDPPVRLPSDWVQMVNAPHSEEELAAVRNSVNRQCPFGESDWVRRTAGELGLEQSVAARGRPRKSAIKK